MQGCLHVPVTSGRDVITTNQLDFLFCEHLNSIKDELTVNCTLGSLSKPQWWPHQECHQTKDLMSNRVAIRAGSCSPASLPGFASYFHCFTSQDMLRRWCLSGPTTVYFSQNSSKTIAKHYLCMCIINQCISLPFAAKQECGMIKFCIPWGTYNNS